MTFALRLVEDPARAFEADDWPRRLNAPDVGQLAYSASPNGRNTDWAAKDLLRALGKDSSMSGSYRNAFRRFDDALAWLLGHQVTDIVVGTVDAIPADALGLLIETALLADCQLWLVAAEPQRRRGLRQLLEDWPLERHPLDDLSRRLTVRKPGPPVGGNTHSSVPNDLTPDEFPTFLATALKLESTPRRREVRAAYERACDETAEWLVQLRDRPDEDAIAEQLRVVHRRHADTLLATAAIRAVQATLLLVGIAVKVALNELLMRHEANVALNDATVGLLRRYAAPRYPALATLQISCDVSWQALSTIRLRDVEDTRGVLVAGAHRQVHPVGQLFIRAHLAHRFLAGGLPDSPFLVNSEEQPLTLRGQQRMVTTMSRETGIPLISHWTARTESTRRRWVYRRGIAVKDLGEAA